MAPTADIRPGDKLVHVGHRRHVSAGPRRGAGGDRRPRNRPDVRAHHRAPLSGADRSPYLLVLGQGAAAAPRPEEPADRTARRRAAAARAGAADESARPSPPPSRRRAGGNPAAGEPVVHPAHVPAGLLANIAPASGVALALQPDFLALVILYWCIQEPRYVGVGVAWMLGLVMDVADADGVRPARARLRGARVLRRIFPPPRAALSRCGSRRRRWRCCSWSARCSCCSCVSSAARRCRAGRMRAADRRRAAVAAAVGAAAMAAAAVPLACGTIMKRPPRSPHLRSLRVPEGGGVSPLGRPGGTDLT